MRTRTHECPQGHKWTAQVELSDTTTNLSGEKTQFCPECGKRSMFASRVHEQPDVLSEQAVRDETAFWEAWDAADLEADRERMEREGPASACSKFLRKEGDDWNRMLQDHAEFEAAKRRRWL